MIWFMSRRDLMWYLSVEDKKTPIASFQGVYSVLICVNIVMSCFTESLTYWSIIPYTFVTQSVSSLDISGSTV